MVVVLTQVADDFEFSFLFWFFLKVCDLFPSLASRLHREKAKINSKPDFIHTKKKKKKLKHHRF